MDTTRADEPGTGQTGKPAPVFLTGEWRHLAMVNYEVDPAILAGVVPFGTELDDYHGRVFVSMVGFLFLRVKIFGLYFPFHVNFPEVNLRFYVRRPQPDGTWRRGAVFIREIVPRLAIATVARLWYNEPYLARPMRHRVEEGGVGVSARYEWKYGRRWNHLSVETERGRSEAGEIAVGSEEEFITEHYWGYTAQRGGGSLEYQVEHPRWRVWRSQSSRLDCDVARLYGEAYVPYLAGPASSAFIAEGSPVSIRRGVLIERLRR